MSEHPLSVYRVLELAEAYTPEADIPDELTDALTFCIARGWAHIKPVAALLDPNNSPDESWHRSGPYRDGPFRVVLEGPDHCSKRLLLRNEGRGLLAQWRMSAEPDCELPADGTKFEEEDVPAAFREEGKPNGAVLLPKYLKDHPEWELLSPYLTKHYKTKVLTRRVQVGQSYAYLYKDLCELRVRKTVNEAARERSDFSGARKT